MVRGVARSPRRSGAFGCSRGRHGNGICRSLRGYHGRRRRGRGRARSVDEVVAAGRRRSGTWNSRRDAPHEQHGRSPLRRRQVHESRGFAGLGHGRRRSGSWRPMRLAYSSSANRIRRVVADLELHGDHGLGTPRCYEGRGHAGVRDRCRARALALAGVQARRAATCLWSARTPASFSRCRRRLDDAGFGVLEEQHALAIGRESRCDRRSGGCGSCRRAVPAAGDRGVAGSSQSSSDPAQRLHLWRYGLARPDRSRPGRRGHRDRWDWKTTPRMRPTV